MAENSLFAILLRSPWWISMAIAAGVVLLAMAILPRDLRIIGALSSLPFLFIGALAIRRQWRLPGKARISTTLEAVDAMSWPAFAKLLEASFLRDGYTVRPGNGAAVDFEVVRDGRKMLVSARRWKAVRTGIEPLRALQSARKAAGAPDALYICIHEISDQARLYAAEHGIAVWQAAELALALRGLALSPAAPGPRTQGR